VAQQTRQQLLDATLAYVTEHGIGDIGFRELARALGTTHRALGYHFGSKEGLLVEIVRTVEATQRAALAALVTPSPTPSAGVSTHPAAQADSAGRDGDRPTGSGASRGSKADRQAGKGEAEAKPELSPVDRMRRMAEQLTDPALWPSERLFFELYGQALQGRPHAADLLPEVVYAWVEPLTAISREMGVPEEDAPACARLLLAVARGLLLDLVATGDRAVLERSADLFFDLFDRYSRPQ
jgi:AcrR family transcriptional regulator